MSGHMKSMLKGVDQFARTPEVMKKMLFEMFRKDERYFHDPCPTNPQFDGLAVPWKALNFVNPPFDNIRGWLEHAVEQKGVCSSVFLVPFRAETQYFFDEVLPHSSCVIVWINRIVFPPHTSALPNTMATYCIGNRIPRKLDGVQLLKVNMLAWDLKTEGVTNSKLYFDVLMPAIRNRISVPSIVNKDFVNHESLRFSKQGLTFVGGMDSPKQVYSAVMQHCKQYPRSTVIVLARTSFNACYMADVVKHIQCIILLKPFLYLNGYRSYIGSALLMFGKPIRVSQGIKVKRAYFALHNKCEPIRD